MPRAKNDPVDAPHAVETARVCGHVNKHFYNTEGKLQDLKCDLPVGHAPVLLRVERVKNEKGEISEVPIYGVVHSADYTYLRADIIPLLKQRVTGEKITYVETTRRGEWLDAAGIPAPTSA